MTRRRKWILAVVVPIALVALGMWLSYLVLLPQIVRREVESAFARIGFHNIDFDLRGATLWQADVQNLASTDDQSLNIGSIRVRYSPFDAITGKLETIIITGGRIVIDLDKPPHISDEASTSPDGSFDLPFRRLDLKSSLLVLMRGGATTVELPIHGALVKSIDGTAQVQIDSAMQQVPLTISGFIDPRDGSAEISASANGLEVGALLELLPRDRTKNLDSAGGKLNLKGGFSRTRAGDTHAKLELALDDIWLKSGDELAVYEINGTIVFSDLLELSTQPRQTLRASRLMIGENELRDVSLTFLLESRNRLIIEDLRSNYAGGLLRVKPFAIDPSNPAFATTLVAEQVRLREIVALLTQKRATGQGTVSGSVPIAVAWPEIQIGEGSFRANKPGKLELGDATSDFGELLENSNPAFKSDPALSQLKDDALLALRDFNFHLLEVRFRRQNKELITVLKIHGKGAGQRPLPLNLQVSIEGAVDALNAYLSVQSRVFKNVKVKGFE